MGFPLLSLIVFLPAAGAVVLMFLRSDDAVRWTALGITASIALVILATDRILTDAEKSQLNEFLRPYLDRILARRRAAT